MHDIRVHPIPGRPGYPSTTYVQSAMFVSSELLVGVAEVASRLHVDADALATSSGLDRRALHDSTLFVEWELAAVFMERLAEEARCPHLGLLVLARQPRLNVGFLGHLARSARDLGTAMQLLARYITIWNQALAWQIQAEASIVQVARLERSRRGAGLRQLCIMGVGAAVSSLKSIVEHHWSPLSISFAFARPRDTRPFREFFGTPVHFGQEFSGFSLRCSDLALPLPHRDDSLCHALDSHAKALLHEADSDDLVEQTRMLVRRYLGSPNCTLRGIAAILAIHPKGLQRQLQKRGESFRKIAQDVRYDVVREQIERGHVPLSELAVVVGLSDGSAVSRGFKLRHGMSPKQWHRARRR